MLAFIQTDEHISLHLVADLLIRHLIFLSSPLLRKCFLRLRCSGGVKRGHRRRMPLWNRGPVERGVRGLSMIDYVRSFVLYVTLPVVQSSKYISLFRLSGRGS